MKRKTVGIIGNGFVGEAQAFAFSASADVKIYDTNPSRATHTLNEVLDQEFIFVCLPTPMSLDGTQDLSYIENVFSQVTPGPIFIIKSTILPGTTKKINEEYNESYIEVVGETHCIFDLKYGFFTEKSIKPVLSEKFVMIYGSNKVYKEYKRIGIELFLNELGIYDIEEKNELEQIDRIVNFLKKCDKEYLKKLYIEKYDILKNNKKILFDYYCKIMNKINVIFLEDKK